ncbi:MAG TPA: GAF domain-containing protein [Candidatus Mcinerneyibacterium sp.]|nr:GAF domain-containing protein [Candidatus Mcinerneyibacterium sp.]
MNNKYEEILNKINNLKKDENFMQEICSYLYNKIDHYDWVGFYMINENNKNELILGPFKGEPTEHTKIEVGEGICGQAADKKETFIVPDVKKADNYLSCSPDVKSEIVIPIFKNYEVIGEIDIDSHDIDSFNKEDEQLLQKIADIVVNYLDNKK